MNLLDKKKTKSPRHASEDDDLSDEELFFKQAPADEEGGTGREKITQDPTTEDDTESQNHKEE